MIELAINKLQKYYGAAKVLDDITFEVQTSEKVGIVGCNGCGKSTLLKIIIGLEAYEKGDLAVRKGAALGYLEQMPDYPDNFKATDVLKTAFKKADNIYEQLEILEEQLSNADDADMERLLKKYADLQTQYENMGGYEKEEKLSKVCTGLKIDDILKEKLFLQLSGGEKTTVILAKILLQNPDILLLDEPSNHLDFHAMEWLEDYLKNYKGAVIIVSHDRYFLDNVVTKIVEIENMTAKSYIGNYTAFVKEKEMQMQLQLEAFLNQQKKINSMEKAIARLRDWGQRGDNEKFFKRAASMEKLLNKIEKIDKPITEKRTVSINANTSGRSGNEVVIVESLTKKLGAKEILRGAELLVRKGEAVALIGDNGTGKSTLIKILLGIEQADKGTAYLGNSVKLGYLQQNIAFPDENKTILEIFRDNIVITEGKAREYLARYMFYGESVFKKARDLSGGERSRLKLAIIMHNEVNLLILDEPTNHLDIDTREELEALLKRFNGTLFFVSHDRYFINNIAGRVVSLENGLLTSYAGNYEYYKEKSQQLKKLTENKKAVIEKAAAKPKKEKIVVNNKGDDKVKLEIQIEKLEESLKIIDKDIEKFSDNYEKLNILYGEKLKLQEEIDRLMEKYLS